MLTERAVRNTVERRKRRKNTFLNQGWIKKNVIKGPNKSMEEILFSLSLKLRSLVEFENFRFSINYLWGKATAVLSILLKNKILMKLYMYVYTFDVVNSKARSY